MMIIIINGLPTKTNKDSTITKPSNGTKVANVKFRPKLKKNKITKRFLIGLIHEAICCCSRRFANPRPAKNAPTSMEKPKYEERVAKINAQEITVRNNISVFFANKS